MMRLPRHSAELALVLLLSTPLVLRAQQKVDIRQQTTSTVAVRISGTFAQLRVIGWSYDSIALSGTLPRGARLDGGIGSPQAAVPGAKFWIEASPTDPNGGVLEMHVPRRARVWVKTNNAQVYVDGVSGSVDLNIVAGLISLRGSPGEANIESMDGQVVVEGSPSWMRIKTADGNVSVRGSTTDLAVTTVSGEVSVNDGKFERVRLESVTGPLLFGGELVRGATLTMDTHSGPLEFSAARKVNLDMDVRALTGRIDNMLSPKRPSPGRDGRGEELILELGTGGAQSTLRTFKGSIRLVAK